MEIKVIAKFEVEGVHRWKDCPFEEVSFLRDYHRHIFHFKVTVKVDHAERDIEIIMLGRKAKQIAEAILEVPVDHSCETIAGILGLELANELKILDLSRIEVECLEDGENGAVVQL